MDDKQLKKLITLCKKNGIQSIKTGQVELTFLPYAPKTRAAKASSKSDKLSVEGELTDQDYLFWSSRGELNG